MTPRSVHPQEWRSHRGFARVNELGEVCVCGGGVTCPNSAAQGRVEDSSPGKKTWGARIGRRGEPAGREGLGVGELGGRRREKEERGVLGRSWGRSVGRERPVRREGSGRAGGARYLESNFWPSGKVPT